MDPTQHVVHVSLDGRIAAHWSEISMFDDIINNGGPEEAVNSFSFMSSNV